MPTHELIQNRNGTYSLREIKSGEVMHSSVGPREEATLLYVEQSRLADRLRETALGELVLFDVGLGAGTNALAALTCHREAVQAGPARKLTLVSFENDPSGLRLALANKERFPFFEGFEDAATALLEQGRWQSHDGLVDWQLHAGHFLDNLAGRPSPEVIFFDFYSPKVVPELWGVSLFERVRGSCAAQASLYTYSASTRVRVALLLAGFYVGYGRNTGAKSDTTVASTRLEELERPLDQRWLERLERSHAALPHDWPEERRTEMIERVLGHAQFRP